MGFLIWTIIAGILALVISPFSLVIAEWLVWSLYLLVSIMIYIKGKEYIKRFMSGESLMEKDIMGMGVSRELIPIVIIILGAFLFLNVSKFHLLWIIMSVSFLYELIWSNHWVKNMDPEVMQHRGKDTKK